MPRRKRPFAENRGGRWRARWPGPNGKLDGASVDDNGQPFADKAAALQYGYEQMGQIQRGEWADPRKGQITFAEWVNRWWQGVDVDTSTASTYRWEIETLLLPEFENWTLIQFGESAPEVAAWQKRLVAAGYSQSTATKARLRLGTILDDAIETLGLRMTNPARLKRGRGRRSAHKNAAPRRDWATPLEVLLIAERAAILSGRDDEFTFVICKAFTGMRLGEAVGLERGKVQPAALLVESQLHELAGKFYRKAPKELSYRNGADGHCGPVDLPPFLAKLLSRQAQKMAGIRCRCTGVPPLCDGGSYMFLRPDRTHPRRTWLYRQIWRPAVDGWYLATQRRSGTRPAMPVLVDASGPWPGVPVQPWPAAVPGEPYEPPRSGQRTGRKHIPTGTPLASWLPIRRGFLVHGLRHGHRTWLAEDSLPEVALYNRLGHRMPGIGAVYTHVSPAMRRQLVNALQRRWEQALRERARLDPHSPVPLLDELLGSVREHTDGVCSQIAPKRQLNRVSVDPESGPDLRLIRGAGDGNRTRAVSLGS
jgi:integrase